VEIKFKSNPVSALVNFMELATKAAGMSNALADKRDATSRKDENEAQSLYAGNMPDRGIKTAGRKAAKDV
jgi:hypothetical protein